MEYTDFIQAVANQGVAVGMLVCMVWGGWKLGNRLVSQHEKAMEASIATMHRVAAGIDELHRRHDQTQQLVAKLLDERKA